MKTTFWNWPKNRKWPQMLKRLCFTLSSAQMTIFRLLKIARDSVWKSSNKERLSRCWLTVASTKKSLTSFMHFWHRSLWNMSRAINLVLSLRCGIILSPLTNSKFAKSATLPSSLPTSFPRRMCPFIKSKFWSSRKTRSQRKRRWHLVSQHSYFCMFYFLPCLSMWSHQLW